MAVFLLPLLVALVLIPESVAIVRAERHLPSQSLQNDIRNKRQAYPYGYGYAAQGQGYNYPQYSGYPTYGSYGSHYNMQPNYGGYSQYPQYQPYPYHNDYSNYHPGYQPYPYHNDYSNYHPGYGTTSFYQQPASGGLQRNRWGNSYMVLGNFKLNVGCKFGGCPGK